MQQSLIMTMGPQGGGKSTWARKFSQEHPEFVYLSSDRLRAELGAGEHDQGVSHLAFKAMYERAENALKNGKSVLLDSTFIKKAWRKDYVALGKECHVRLIAHVFMVDLETLIKRIQKRVANGGLNVPPEDVERYLKMFQPPDKSEFDEIINH